MCQFITMAVFSFDDGMDMEPDTAVFSDDECSFPPISEEDRRLREMQREPCKFPYPWYSNPKIFNPDSTTIGRLLIGSNGITPNKYHTFIGLTHVYKGPFNDDDVHYLNAIYQRSQALRDWKTIALPVEIGKSNDYQTNKWYIRMENIGTKHRHLSEILHKEYVQFNRAEAADGRTYNVVNVATEFGAHCITDKCECGKHHSQVYVAHICEIFYYFCCLYLLGVNHRGANEIFKDPMDNIYGINYDTKRDFFPVVMNYESINPEYITAGIYMGDKVLQSFVERKLIGRHVDSAILNLDTFVRPDIKQLDADLGPSVSGFCGIANRFEILKELLVMYRTKIENRKIEQEEME
jgi:hypothetical protein